MKKTKPERPKRRTVVKFNTGSRVHKDGKAYRRVKKGEYGTD